LQDTQLYQPDPASLDAGPSPAATVVGTISCRVAVAELVVDVETQKRRRKPEASADKAERLSSLPLATKRTVRKPTPTPNATTRQLVDVVDEGAEGGEPGGRDEEIQGVVHEVAGEGEEPDQGEQHADGGDDLDVDFTPSGADVVFVVSVKEVGVQPEHHRRADKFTEAKEYRRKA